MSKKYEIFLFDLDGKSSASKRQTGQNYINLSVRRLQSPLRNFTVLQKSRVWME